MHGVQLKNWLLHLFASVVCTLSLPVVAEGIERNVLVLSTLARATPWQSSLEQGILKQDQDYRVTNFDKENPNLYFESVDWLNNSQSTELQKRANDIVQEYRNVPFDLVIAIGQPASAVYELISDKIGFPPAEYVDTAWGSSFGLDSDSIRRPEAIYRSARLLSPDLQRLIYIGNYGFTYQDLIDFDTLPAIEFEPYQSFATHEEWDALLASLKSTDLILLDASMTMIDSELHFPFRLASEIVAGAEVPVLVTQAPLIEIPGVLGGLVTDSFELGRAVAQIAWGETPDLSRLHRQIYIHSELERFGLTVAGLGPDVEVRGETYLSIKLEQAQGYLGFIAFCLSGLGMAWMLREKRSNRRLIASEGRARVLASELETLARRTDLALDASGIGQLAIDIESQQLIVDARFKRLYGLALDTDVDFPLLTELIHDDDLETVLGFRARAYGSTPALGDEKLECQYRIVSQANPDGHWLKVVAKRVAIDGHESVIGCVYSVNEEHAKQQALSDALEQSDNLARSGGVALMKHDLRTDELEVNEVFRELFGLSKDRYPKIYFADFLETIPAKYPNKRRAIIESMRQRDHVIHSEARFHREDGSNFYCKIQLNTRFEGNSPVEVSGSFIDITSRRKLELQLRETLKQREEAVRALEAKQQVQQQMFAVIGHELRTPAAAINMMLDAQTSTSKGPYSQDIRRTAKHLLGVLDDLRAVIEPEVLAKRMAETDVVLDVVERTLVPLRDRLQQADLSVNISSDAASASAYHFDVRGLRQVSINLIKNAALHSGASRLDIGLQVVNPLDSEPHLKVAFCDDGKGIPEAKWESIFEPFVRGETDEDGTGLGLHICRELLRASGGDVKLERAEQGGCCFLVELPLKPAHALVELEANKLQKDFKNQRVLLAEDNLTLRMLTEQILKGQGAKASCAVDGKAALAAIEADDFDLLLTDIFMPQMDGYELVTTLRAQGFDKPIIGITAAMVGDEAERLIAAGADTVIPKPVTTEKLLGAWSEVSHLRT